MRKKKKCQAKGYITFIHMRGLGASSLRACLVCSSASSLHTCLAGALRRPFRTFASLPQARATRPPPAPPAPPPQDMQESLALLEELAAEEGAGLPVGRALPAWVSSARLSASSSPPPQPAHHFLQDAVRKVLAEAGLAGDLASCDRVVTLLIQAPMRRLSPDIVLEYLRIMAAAPAAALPPQHARAFAFCAMVQGAEASAYRAVAAQVREEDAALRAALVAQQPQLQGQLPHARPPPLLHVLPSGGAHGAYCLEVLKAQGREALAAALALARDPASQLDCTAAASIAHALASAGLAGEARAWLESATALRRQGGGEYLEALEEACSSSSSSSSSSIAAPSPAPLPGGEVMDAVLADAAVSLALAEGLGGSAGAGPAPAPAAAWMERAGAAHSAALVVCAAHAAHTPLQSGPMAALGAVLEACESQGPTTQPALVLRDALLATLPDLYLSTVANGTATRAAWNRVLRCLSAVGVVRGVEGIFSCARGALDLLGTAQAWHVVRRGGGGMRERGGSVGAGTLVEAVVRGGRRGSGLPPPRTLSRAASTTTLNACLRVLLQVALGAAPAAALPTASTAASSPAMLAHDLLAVAWSWQSIFGAPPQHSSSSSSSSSSSTTTTTTSPSSPSPLFLSAPDAHTFRLALSIARRGKDTAAEEGILGLIRTAGVAGQHYAPMGLEELEQAIEAEGAAAQGGEEGGAFAGLVLPSARSGVTRARAREALLEETRALYHARAPRAALKLLKSMVAAGVDLRGDTLSLHIKGLLACAAPNPFALDAAAGASAAACTTALLDAASPELCLPNPAKGDTFVCANLQGLAEWLRRYREGAYAAAVQCRGGSGSAALPDPATILAAVLRRSEQQGQQACHHSISAQAGLVHALQGFSLADFDALPGAAAEATASAAGTGALVGGKAATLAPMPALPAAPPLPEDPLRAFLPSILALHTEAGRGNLELQRELSDAASGRLARAARTASPLRLAQVYCGLHAAQLAGPSLAGGANALLSSTVTLDLQRSSTVTVAVFLLLLSSELALRAALGLALPPVLEGGGGQQQQQQQQQQRRRRGLRNLVLITGVPGNMRSVRALYALCKEAPLAPRHTGERTIFLSAEGLSKWAEGEGRRLAAAATSL